MTDKKDKKGEANAQEGFTLTLEYLNDLTYPQLQQVATQANIDPNQPQASLVAALEGVIMPGRPQLD